MCRPGYREVTPLVPSFALCTLRGYLDADTAAPPRSTSADPASPALAAVVAPGPAAVASASAVAVSCSADTAAAEGKAAIVSLEAGAAHGLLLFLFKKNNLEINKREN